LLVYGLVLGPVSGLLNGLAGGLLYAVGFGYALEILESSDTVWRWIRTRRVWGLLAGICWGLLPGMGYSPYLPRFVAVDGLTDHWIARLVLGLTCGFVIGLAPAIQYRVVLLLLRRRGLVPAHLEHFLDYAADHTLLKRRGGKYLFVHELLQTYFADLMTQE
jgi:MFS family permease